MIKKFIFLSFFCVGMNYGASTKDRDRRQQERNTRRSYYETITRFLLDLDCESCRLLKNTFKQQDSHLFNEFERVREELQVMSNEIANMENSHTDLWTKYINSKNNLRDNMKRLKDVSLSDLVTRKERSLLQGQNQTFVAEVRGLQLQQKEWKRRLFEWSANYYDLRLKADALLGKMKMDAVR